MEEIKNIFTDTFTNLTFYVRDTNLPVEIISKYKKGMIICEPSSLMASFKVGGIFTNCRFAILSNHMLNVSPIDAQTNFGLFMAEENSYFKILDVAKKNETTQILLLHLRKESWELFKNLDMISSFDLIKLGRDTFESCFFALPVFEHKNKEWLDICQKAVGINQDGNFFKIGQELQN